MWGGRFYLRKLISLALMLLCFVMANLSCRYQEVFRSSDQNGVVQAVEEDLTELSASRLYMAGWPQKFYIKVEFDDLPAYSQFQWKGLAINALLWAVAISGFVLYESRLYGLWKEGTAGKKRRLTIVDLFACTGIIAAAIAYWRTVERASAAESALAVEIATAGGSSVQSISLPQTAFNLVPNSMRLKVKRISEVTLNSPSSELLAKTLTLPYLTRLNIGGGDYDLKLLQGLASKPLLSVLRVSGRRLDPQAIATLATAHQLQSLNLMRTNITAKALEPLSSLPRLQALNLIHTDVVLSEIGTPGWSKTVRALLLPHPPAGRGDHLKLEGWPELRTFTCNEYDERLNSEAVTLELKNLPRLRKIALDALQSFDLQLDQLPELAEIQPLHAQWNTRVTPKEMVPRDLAIRSLSLGSLPSLRSLKLAAHVIEQMRFSQPLSLRLELADAPIEGSIGTRFMSFAGLAASAKPAWVDGWSETNGPSEVVYTDLPMSELSLAKLAKCEAIRSLNFTSCTIHLAQVRQLGGMKGLEELSLFGNALDGQTLAWLAANLPSLRRLHCDPLIHGVLKLENLPQLEHVLGSPDFPVISVDSLRLVGMTGLKDPFDLPEELRNLKIENAPSLTGLSTRAPWPVTARLKGVRDLTYFTAGGPRLDDSVVQEVLACENLQALTLAYSGVSPAMLGKIGTLKNLQYLALSGSKVDDDVVAQWQGLTSLRTLRLDYTAITDKAIDFIAGCNSLQRLSLQGTKVSAGGLARLSELSELSRVDCGGADLSAERLKAICTIQSLSTLDLSDSTVTAEMLAVLQASPPRMFHAVILRSCQVDSQALMQLADQHSGLLFDLTYSNADPSVLTALASTEQIVPPTAEEQDTQGLISTYLRNAYMRSRGVAIMPDVQPSAALPVKSQVEPRRFAPNFQAASSIDPSWDELGFRSAEPPIGSFAEPMSLPAMVGYAIGQLSKTVSEFANQGASDVEQY